MTRIRVLFFSDPRNPSNPRHPRPSGTSAVGVLAADLWLLLALRARSAVNAVRFARPLHRLVGALLGGASLLLFVGIFAAFRVLLAAVAQTGDEALLHALVGRTFLFLFLFLLAGAVPFVSGALFAPGDLALLLAAPVRPGAVVVARLLDAAIVSSAQFVVIGLPLLVASAAGVGLPVWGWLVAFLLFLLFLLLPALLTAALLLVVARVIGLRRVRGAVALASALLAVGMCLLMVGEFAGRAGRIGAGGVAAISRSAAEGTFRLPAPPDFLPSTWASNALVALASPRPARAFVPFGALLLATLFSGALAVLAGRRVLLGETLLEGEGGGTGGTGKASALEKGLGRVGALSPAARALVAKDARYVARDLVLLSQIGIPIILYLVPFVIAGRAGGSGAAVMGREEIWGLSAALVGVIAYMETSILGLSSVGLEGRGFWMILHAPVGAATFVRAKFVFACGTSLVLCLPLYLFSCLLFGMGAVVTLAGTGVLIVACAALSGLAVGIAGLFPRFVYDNPAHRASLAALIWGFVGATVYVLLAGAALGGGAWLAVQPQWTGPRAGLVWAVAGALFCLLSLLTAVVPLLLARGRLNGYAWEE